MTVEQRLDQLEKRNKCLTAALTLMAVATCAVVTMAATIQRGDFDVIKAQAFYVTNDVGENLIYLGSTNGGEAGVVATYTSKGTKLVDLSATRNSHGIVTTYHPNGKELVGLTASDHGGIVTTYQPNGIELVNLTRNDNGGKVNVFNTTGERIAQVYADEYGNGVVYAGNRKGEGRTLRPGP